MHLTIVAATGGIGRHLLQQAVTSGHDVTVWVRNPAKLPPELPIRTVVCDLSQPDSRQLAEALAATDAVLSGLGPAKSETPGVATEGTRALLGAMHATGTRRIVVVSAAPIGTVASPQRPRPPRHDPGDGLVMRHLLNPVVKTALRTHYADLAAMEDLVRDSNLDWTIARPPKLTDGPLTGTYRTELDRNIPGGWSISRADVAHQMLHALDRPETIKRTVGMATGPTTTRP